MELKNRFEDLITRYSRDKAFNFTCWNSIKDNYSKPFKPYHNLAHIENIFSELKYVQAKINDIDSLSFSIFYHDVIYDAQRGDNEFQSALFMEHQLSKTNFANIEKCKKQILATKQHLQCDDADTNFLLDLDLSILGRNRDEYNAYCKAIRVEYSMYDDVDYSEGRKKVLKHFLGSTNIFKTDFFIEKYEQPARENIKNELAHLS